MVLCGNKNLTKLPQKIFKNLLTNTLKYAIIKTLKERLIKMTVAELIRMLSQQNQDYVIYREHEDRELREACWGDFQELFWIWDKSEVEEDD